MKIAAWIDDAWVNAGWDDDGIPSDMSPDEVEAYRKETVKLVRASGGRSGSLRDLRAHQKRTE